MAREVVGWGKILVAIVDIEIRSHHALGEEDGACTFLLWVEKRKDRQTIKNASCLSACLQSGPV